LQAGRDVEPARVRSDLQLAALRRRETVSAYAEVMSSVGSPWRQRFSERGLSGEVVVAGAGAGRLDLFVDKKPVCAVEGALPPPLAGAIDSPRFTVKPGFTGVVEDEQYEEAVYLVKVAGERLAAQLVPDPKRPDLDPVLVQLAFWVASSMAWHWKGKKAQQRRRMTGCRRRTPVAVPLSARPTAARAGAQAGEPASQRRRGRSGEPRGRFLEAGEGLVRGLRGAGGAPGPHPRRHGRAAVGDSIRQRPCFEEVFRPSPASAARAAGAVTDGEVAWARRPTASW
jgi:hypothetical protein